MNDAGYGPRRASSSGDIGRDLSRRQVLAWGAGGLLVLALPSCSAADPDQAGSAPKAGGELTIAQNRDIAPKAAVTQATFNQSWRRQVYNTVIRYDRRSLEPQPELATRWTVSPDGKTVEFTLREGVKWHSGRAFDAADAAFTIESMATNEDLPFPFKWLLQLLSDVEGKGDTLTLAFSEPVGRKLFDMLDLMIVIDRESVDGFVDGSAQVGTGPFRWGDYRPNTSLTLERNADYWRADRPYLDRVVIRFIPRSEALLSGLRSGQFGMGLNLQALDLRQVEDDGRFEITQYDTYGQGIYLGCNAAVDPLGRPEVRQAVNYAIDRDRINAEIYQGQARVTAAPWSPKSPAYDEALAGRYRRDVPRAKTLLQQAGAAGARVALEVSPALQATQIIAEIVSFNLEEAGLDVQTTILEAAQQAERFKNKSYQGLWIGVHGYNQLSAANLFASAAPFKPEGNLSNFTDATYSKQVAATVSAPEDGGARDVTGTLLDSAFCCDLVVATNNAATKGASGWSYTMWDELLLEDAGLA